MKNLKLAVFATQYGTEPSSKNHIAHALLLQDVESKNLVCEIHVGKMITRFIADQYYFLEDVLWQLNVYCQIPSWEIECDVHYPVPISIEEEFGHDDCMESRMSIHSQMIASGVDFHVINWSVKGVDEKVGALKNYGVRIKSSRFRS